MRLTGGVRKGKSLTGARYKRKGGGSGGRGRLRSNVGARREVEL